MSKIEKKLADEGVSLIERKLEIVSRNYAKEYISKHRIADFFQAAYQEGFKMGYHKAVKNSEFQAHELWKKSNNIMQCDICMSQFDLNDSWEYCPVCGTCMDGRYEEM